MQTFLGSNSEASWLVQHPLSTEDRDSMVAIRALVEPNKGKLQGIEARLPFDAIMEHVTASADIFYEADEIGGIPGWWCRPTGVPSGGAIMHIHGGWFHWGSAHAFRHLAGHIAAHSGAAVFVPDYRLAPEHPFPAAIEDVRSCYSGLLNRGYSKIAITGDSAGGNLALGLLVHLAENSDASDRALVAGVALSPVTDLSLSGESWSTRAEADPLFTKPQAVRLTHSYLAGHDSLDPVASPLFADVKGMVPIRVHVGEDEVLLADSIRFVERAISAGVDARLDVWNGMIHGFLGNVGRLTASRQVLQTIGKFLCEQLAE